MIVKTGDTHPIKWRLNMDLTDATVRLIVRPRTGAPIVLDSTISNPVEGEVRHVLTGDLAVGSYRVEVEVTAGGEIATFPNNTYSTLTVIPDLD
ncbi:hypothetical protein GCM10009651_35670 [Microbacterium natoriense]|uniref:hypothetical protein n=1 Tax=Microbacterium natoriense TaxID=284570 RepID=UPI0031DD28C7